MTTVAMQKERLAKGLCRICGKPNNGSVLCDDHRRLANAYQRKRAAKHRESAPKRSPVKKIPGCSLCLSLSHTYGHCPLNADTYYRRSDR